MANKKYTSEQKVEFATRLNQIDNYIPDDFINKVIVANPTIPAARIQNVRYGRTVDFDLLMIFEKMFKPVKVK